MSYVFLLPPLAKLKSEGAGPSRRCVVLHDEIFACSLGLGLHRLCSHDGSQGFQLLSDMVATDLIPLGVTRQVEEAPVTRSEQVLDNDKLQTTMSRKNVDDTTPVLSCIGGRTAGTEACHANGLEGSDTPREEHAETLG